MLRALPEKTAALTAYIHGLLFIGLNVLDAWLTNKLVSIGGQEMLWWLASFNSNMLVKGLLALVIVVVLVHLGKSKLLWLLNVGISIVVLVNGLSFLSYLAGLYQWLQ
jgi:hypothetical protein